MKHRYLLNSLLSLIFALLLAYGSVSLCAAAEPQAVNQSSDLNQKAEPSSEKPVVGHSIDRLSLVNMQIELLKKRIAQSKDELNTLQNQHEKDGSEIGLAKSSKSLLDKASLGIIVAKSRIDNIAIEIADAQQTMGWLDKNIHEIENQLNMMNVFANRIPKEELSSATRLTIDLNYQKKLLALEKDRYKYLNEYQSVASAILADQTEYYNRLNRLLKSYKLLNIKQSQLRDELVYQELQNEQLAALNNDYRALNLLDPEKSKEAYIELERKVFYTNEKANYYYVRSLIARYKDQIDQMKLGLVENSAISVFYEMNEQAQLLSKQFDRLVVLIKSKIKLLERHSQSLSQRTNTSTTSTSYVKRLDMLIQEYQQTLKSTDELQKKLLQYRLALEKELQSELSSRQGLPTLDVKSMVDLGRELFSFSGLSFQFVKSLVEHFYLGIKQTHWFGWLLFSLMQGVLFFGFRYLQIIFSRLLDGPSTWRERWQTGWLILRWMQRIALTFFIAVNTLFVLLYFSIPYQTIILIFYLSLVCFVVKGIIVTARLFLVETTHDTTGHDVKLYNQLVWLFLIAGIITGFTVYVHQLPSLFELKSIFDRLFLLVMMVVSIVLLTSSRRLSDLLLTLTERRHPYIERSIQLLIILAPLLMVVNALIGLMGYVNLIMTISRYEGFFLLVLIGYLLLRGLLTDAMEHISQMTIRYAKNGWLLTEAFLKPLDTVLRLLLFLAAIAVLFLLYGWDKQSPIVERITGLLHYPLIVIRNNSINSSSIIELFLVISVFYWTAKWTREFVYRFLMTRTNDLGIRNSLAILSQYTVIVIGLILCLRVLGFDYQTLVAITGLLAFGVGLGLRDVANNFMSGFLILLERPIRIGDVVIVNDIEGEVLSIGSRAVTIRTWDHTELFVPNTEIFSKTFTNLTAKDSIVRLTALVKISRYENPHTIIELITNILLTHPGILPDPIPDAYLKSMDDINMMFQIRFYVNMKHVKSRSLTMSAVLMKIWDEFQKHHIEPPREHYEVVVRDNKT